MSLRCLALCLSRTSEFAMGQQDLPSRPRRNRRSPTIRGAISETHISPGNLILPVFIHDGEQNLPIASMPGVSRLGWRHGLLDSVAEARSVGVNSVVLFPKVHPVALAVARQLIQQGKYLVLAALAPAEQPYTHREVCARLIVLVLITELCTERASVWV